MVSRQTQCWSSPHVICLSTCSSHGRFRNALTTRATSTDVCSYCWSSTSVTQLWVCWARAWSKQEGLPIVWKGATTIGLRHLYVSSADMKNIRIWDLAACRIKIFHFLWRFLVYLFIEFACIWSHHDSLMLFCADSWHSSASTGMKNAGEIFHLKPSCFNGCLNL